jgi:hypothetical protein
MIAFAVLLRDGHSVVLDEARVPQTVIETVPSSVRELQS